eukprot:TRINITY_DN3372_c0_g1_i1.p6 TRINITY_DN3372_c0_g1~~TRINITY_DN3372_c0_g1_i1.p6  ORF type:complete len:53 (-),score=14.32 TRINITY_DN3372_c0_g1_i1:666-824(-)
MKNLLKRNCVSSIEDNMYLERDEQVDDEDGRRIAEKLTGWRKQPERPLHKKR